jgi:natural product biosynthesis luciferase-like monooxygenase protein/amino acid adenylation domain-containing protein
LLLNTISVPLKLIFDEIGMNTANSTTSLPLTEAQRGVWVAQQLDPHSPRYNCGGYLDITGAIDVDVFRRAVQAALEETEALRTQFFVDDLGPRQLVQPFRGDVIEFIDLSAQSDAEAAALAAMTQDLAEPRRLQEDSLVRHVLFRLSDTRHFFYLRYHHILMDGYSQTIYWRRIGELYTADVTGSESLAGVACPLAELLAAEDAYLSSKDLQKDRHAWLDHLADLPEPLSLSTRAAQSARGRRRRAVTLGAATTDRLHTLARRIKTRWSALLVAAVAVYIRKLSSSDDIVLALPVPARTSAAAVGTPAMLANELPLRLQVDCSQPFSALVGKVTRAIGFVLKHQRYRGESLHRDLSRAGQAGRLGTPVVNVITFDRPVTFGDCSTVPHYLSSGPVNDLLIGCYGSADGGDITVMFDANPESYTPEDLACHQERLLHLLDALLTAHDTLPLDTIDVRLPSERARLDAWNATDRQYDLTHCLHQLVDEQAQRTPDRIAVAVEGASLSYRDLVARADRLAAHLIERGVSPRNRVGVLEIRSLEMSVSLLAILKAGAAYVPLDPDQPVDRLAFQLSDAEIRLVLTRSSLQGQLDATGVSTICVDTALADLPAPEKPLPKLGAPEDAAYVIYTSGSTGRPKGVAVPHRGVVNRLLWMQDQYQLGAEDCVLQKTPYTFDVSVWELFWPLIAGCRLFFAEPGAHRDPRRITELIRTQGVTTIHFVPPMLDLFLEELPSNEGRSLRRVICSGEALRPETVAAFFRAFSSEGGAALHNLYGPTEASIDVTHWTCSPADAEGPVPIGHPVANTQIHILDDHGKPVPVGVAGELYIGGVQVALGYLNRPELNAKCFIVDPFRPGMLYRTGDLARYRRDGAIEFLGRMDQQIKIRGFRIEPGDVESALLSHHNIRHAVVSAWQVTASERRLVAHLVTADGQEIVHRELNEFLAARLPEYMIPQHMIFLRELPLSRNGKVDRAMLPMPSQEPVAGDVVQFQTQEERLLGTIWSDLLGVPVVAPEQSFFALGGDSMLAIRMRSLAERSGYSFDIQDIFRFPTLRLLATRLRAHDAAGTPAKIAPFGLLSPQDHARLPAGVVDAYPVSAMQGGMLFHAEFDPDSSVYRVVTSLRIAVRFDESLLQRAIDDTVRRHAVLRTSFDLLNYSEPLQLVHPTATAPLEVIDATLGQPDARIDAAVHVWVEKAKHHRFDLTRPPLMAFTVHLRNAQSFQLSVIEHHVILDGWSDAAMLQEIVDRYLAALDGQDLWLPAVPSSYADFVARERHTMANDAARTFWQSALVDVEPTRLPRRTAIHSATPGSRHRAFPVPVAAGALAKLQQLAHAEALPLKSLMAAAHVAVQRLVGNVDKVVSGLVVNGRLEHDGGDAVLGVFLNTLPLSIDTAGQSLLSIAQRAFAFESEAAPYRHFPFTEIQREANGLELDSYVNFIDFHALWKRRGADGALISDAIGVAETNYPLAANFLVDPVDGRLRVWLDCDLTQLDESFCDRLSGYYARAIAALIDTPHAVANEIDLIGPEEIALVSAWNDTAVTYDREATVHALFEQRAAAAPDAIAVAHRHEQIAYRELDARANRLARHLVSEGVAPGSLVGVSLYRGIDMVVAMLAVLKAGCAYVPLDPDYPRNRLLFIVKDAGLACLISEQASPIADAVPRTVLLDRDSRRISACDESAPPVNVCGEAAAYVIYTSGSTGLPKGTRIRHRNVVNFFEGMDRRIGCSADDVMLALTSMSFDISVLELLWPLARGARVVIAGEKIVQNLVADDQMPNRTLGLSLFFFSAAAGDDQVSDGYRLVMEAAKIADDLGLEAIWTPERHFHEFGGLYPNPSVMSAALAAVTRRIGLRCGSVVAPLHDSIRIAEEWALVDNLSQGRVGLAFASGWNANDFALAPHAYAERKQHMGKQIEEFRRLWRGEAVERVNGNGETVSLSIFPKPVQETPPLWLTSAGAVETFERAGASGANLLTHLLGQDIDELERKIRAYRAAREAAGHLLPGRVTVMVHTFLDEDSETARAVARGPFREYLRTSTELWRLLFSSMGVELQETITDEDLDSVLDLAVDRYFDRSGLFGSPESVNPTLRALAAAGADEIACLIDFGVPADDALKGIAALGRLKRLHEAEVADAEHSFAALCRRHGATLVQGTPSLMAAICAEPEALAALASTRAVLVGGEAFPAGVADRLLSSLPQTRIFNMYGPTETTIWSTVHELERTHGRHGNIIPIGLPIANTEILILDARMRPVPVGVAGELWIGGEGVAGLYLGRPELTAERFPAHPSRAGQLYRTGDRARWRPDGLLEFFGRVDRQVKILGHRIEPDEVESVLSRHPQVANVAVVAREAAAGRLELVAYVAPGTIATDQHAEDGHVMRWGEIWEGAYADPDTGVAETADREFAGWNSSYTGEPIPPNQMREWLGHTVTSVLRLQPRALIDVGVGVGLLLRNIVPAVDSYLGIDVSETALVAARDSLARVHHDGCRVDLRLGDASLLKDVAAGAADAIVVNSVIQYFPGIGYLDRVVQEATRIVGAHGAVFIGDVRHLGLLEAFHASVQVARAAPLTTAAELASVIARKVAEETELCLAPRYFCEKADTIDTIGNVRIELKRGHAANEMTIFRYDVTLLGHNRTDRMSAASALDWESLRETSDDKQGVLEQDYLLALEARLEQVGKDPLMVTGIPNRRLVKPLALLRLLKELPAETTAWEIERQLWMVDDMHAVDPEEIATLAERLGLEVRLVINPHGSMEIFDAQFSLPGDDADGPGQTITDSAYELMEQVP